MVQVTVSLPDTLAPLLGENDEQLQRRLLEDAVAEACRSGRIGRGEVSRYLGHGSWHETEEFLIKHQIPLDYDSDDLTHDIAVMESFFSSK